MLAPPPPIPTQNYYDATEDDLGLQAWGPLKAWHAGRPQPAPRLERTAQLYAQVVEQTMARELDAR